jgi:hypothetical protein
MAILRKARDDHFYIVKGYPFENLDGEQDVFFATLQVGPRGDSIFRMLEAKDGFQIQKPLYYCLAVEGDIFFGGRAGRPPSPMKIPAQIRNEAEGLYEDEQFDMFRRLVSRSDIRCLCDVIRQCANARLRLVPELVYGLSLARIALLMRQYQHDEQTRKRQAASLASEIGAPNPEKVDRLLRDFMRLIPESLCRAVDVRTFIRQYLPDIREEVLVQIVQRWQSSRWR